MCCSTRSTHVPHQRKLPRLPRRSLQSNAPALRSRPCWKKSELAGTSAQTLTVLPQNAVKARPEAVSPDACSRTKSTPLAAPSAPTTLKSI